MAADLFVAGPSGERSESAGSDLILNDDGYYWFLYPYFETANLDRSTELVDLYGDADIAGYQLERLHDELIEARLDAGCRAETWRVLVGWTNTERSRSTENWQTIDRAKMVALIDRLLEFVQAARSMSGRLVCVGD